MATLVMAVWTVAMEVLEILDLIQRDMAAMTQTEAMEALEAAAPWIAAEAAMVELVEVEMHLEATSAHLEVTIMTPKMINDDLLSHLVVAAVAELLLSLWAAVEVVVEPHSVLAEAEVEDTNPVDAGVDTAELLQAQAILVSELLVVEAAPDMKIAEAIIPLQDIQDSKVISHLFTLLNKYFIGVGGGDNAENRAPRDYRPKERNLQEIFDEDLEDVKKNTATIFDADADVVVEEVEDQMLAE